MNNDFDETCRNDVCDGFDSDLRNFVINGKTLVKYKGNGMKVRVPDGITEITSLAFDDCATEEIYLSDDVKVLKYRSVFNCKYLKRIRIPEGVLEFENESVSLCKSLESIYIPKNAVVHEKNGSKYPSFFMLYGLNEIIVNEENELFESVDNCLIAKASGKLILGSNNSIIPGKGRVKCIGEYAFYNSESLFHLRIPSGVEEIGESAFCFCSSLKDISVSDTVKKIHESSFSDCKSLAKIKVSEENSFFYAENDCLIKKDGEILVRGSNFSVIPDGVVEIGEYAFSGLPDLEAVTISATVKKIDSGAFENCVNLQKVVIPKSVEIISETAFSSFPDDYYDYLTVYCEAERKPATWESGWNNCIKKVVWGYGGANECERYASTDDDENLSDFIDDEFGDIVD